MTPLASQLDNHLLARHSPQAEGLPHTSPGRSESASEALHLLTVNLIKR
jgi:hypothetical protein